MDQYPRRIIGFAVHVGDVDGVTLCRMSNRVLSRQSPPRYLSTEHDPLFRLHGWQANLRVLDIEPVKALPYVPVSPRSLSVQWDGTQRVARPDVVLGLAGPGTQVGFVPRL